MNYRYYDKLVHDCGSCGAIRVLIKQVLQTCKELEDAMDRGLTEEIYKVADKLDDHATAIFSSATWLKKHEPDPEIREKERHGLCWLD